MAWARDVISTEAFPNSHWFDREREKENEKGKEKGERRQNERERAQRTLRLVLLSLTKYDDKKIKKRGGGGDANPALYPLSNLKDLLLLVL